MSIDEIIKDMDADQLRVEIKKSMELLGILGKVIHDLTVGQQAAWIEWRHGDGAEAGMRWVHNGLAGPGHIPDEDAPYGKEAQAYFNANCSDPIPQCACGRPSGQLWMGHGACCNEHMQEAMAKHMGSQP